MKKLQHYLSLLVLLGSVLTSPIYALDQEQAAASGNQPQVVATADQEAGTKEEVAEPAASPLASSEGAPEQAEEVSVQESAKVEEASPASQSSSEQVDQPKVRGKRSLEAGVAAGGALTLTGVKVTPEKSPADTNTSIRFDATFTVPNGAKGGETATITLPDSIRYTGDTSFELKDSSGNKVADGRVNGNLITLTYTNYVETHSDITGSLFYYFKMNNITNTTPEDKKVTITVDNKTTVDVTVKVGVNPGTASEQFNKVSYSSKVQDDGTVLRTYELRIDASKDLPSAVIEDTLVTAGMTYESGSFEAYKGTWGTSTGSLQLEKATAITLSQPTFSSDKRSFTLNVGDVKKGDGYKIIYTVRIDYTPTQGEKFKNTAKLKSNGADVTYKDNEFDYKSAGGQAEGSVFTVKVHKTDADSSTNLAGAVFNVVRKSTGQVVGTITTDANGNASIGNLLRTNYQLVETKAPTGYVLDETPIEISSSDFGSDKAVTKEVANKKEEAKVTSVQVRKEWSDKDDQDGKRPNFVTVHLLKDGTRTGDSKVLSADNNWIATFENLPVGSTYTIEEDAVAGYELTANQADTTGVIVLTNSHTPETTSLEGKKVWDDNNNQDKKRPASITVDLYKTVDGVTSKVEGKSANVTGSGNEWSFSFTDLPKYENKKEITYSIKEVAVDGYTTKVEGTTITNTYSPEMTKLEGKKVWDDHNNQDGLRKDITVRLLADGVETDKTVLVSATGDGSFSFDGLAKYKDGQAIVYSVKEENTPEGYEATVEGTTIINTHTPETTSISGKKVWVDKDNQDGKRAAIRVRLYADGEKTDQTKEVGIEDDARFTFEGLAKYKEGKLVTYTVKEENVPAGYTSKVEGTTITNTYTPETTKLEGKKVWSDKNNQDGKRAAITVRLYADGEATDQTKEVGTEDQASFAFEGLPKYKDGKEIVYTVKEENVPVDYTSTVEGTTITNTYTPETTKLEGKKVWSDKENQDGKRAAITVRLYADGEKTDLTKEVGTADEESFVFEDLAKYKDGKEIVYTVKEENVPEGYNSTVEGATITNTYSPGTTSVSGVKTWFDDEDRDGIRPTSIKVTLVKTVDGKSSDLETKEVSADAEGRWTYNFTNLPKMENGKAITYSVKEETVKGYASKVVDGSFDITNTHEIDVTNLTLVKKWEDKDNQDGLRPTSIRVDLLADGQVLKSVELNESNQWTYDFLNLPKKANGKEIVYSVKEQNLPAGYEATVDGMTTTNSHTPETTKLEGKKVWSDSKNQDGKRAAITVRLYADGEKTDLVKEVGTADEESFVFENLPKYKDGKEIVYTVKEEKVPAGYTSSVEGTTITNTYTPVTTKIKVKKVWKDMEDQAKKRPSQLKVYLVVDGQVVEGSERVLTAANNWTVEYTELTKYAAGKAISYQVREELVAGYELEFIAVNADGTEWTLQNKLLPQEPKTPQNKEEKPKKVLPRTGQESSIVTLFGLFLLVVQSLYFFKKRA